MILNFASAKQLWHALGLFLSLAVAGAGVPAIAESAVPSRATEIIRQLTLEEKAILLSGRDDWHVGGIERVGLPLMRMSDCGHGVTLAAPPYGSATCLPTSVGMASTWNEDLLFEAGELLGRETRAKGCGLLLGPMANLHRLPLGGRNYETFSEDPLLTGKMAAALIRGIQSTGTGACLKAIACNNQQKDQHATSVTVDERTLREMYLRAFEIAVNESRPWAIMTSYNPLNGVQPSENPHLLTDIVRRDWSFGGLLVSDWRAVESVRALNAGLNLEMPGPGKQLKLSNIQAALASGQLTMEQLNKAITPMVELLLKYAANTNGPGEMDSQRHRGIARRLAEESLVLLKNDKILPLDAANLKSLAVIGPNAAHARLGGGGSASVTPFYAVSPLDGLRKLVGDRMRIDYAEGGGLGGGMPVIPASCLRTKADAAEGLEVEFFDNPLLRGEPCKKRVDPNIDFAWGWASPMNGVPRFHFSARWSGFLIPPVTGKYKLNLVAEQSIIRLRLDGKLLLNGWEDRLETKFEELFSNRSLTETVELTAGVPTPIVIEFGKTGPKAAIRLQWETPNQEDPIEAACKVAARCDAAVVCVGLANIFEGGNLDRASYELPGRQVELIRRVAAVNPRTAVVLVNGSVVSVAEWLDTVPAVIEAWYPGQEGGNAIAAALFGGINPSGRLPDTIFRTSNDILALKNYPGDDKRVSYAEGMKVGYRQVRPNDESVVFPFGFGLSYTSFEFAQTGYDAKTSEVTVRVKNTGKRAGGTVVQVYRQRGQPAEDDPWRELVAFRKIQLSPGETQTVKLALPPEAFRSWCNVGNRWQRDPRLTALWVTLDALTGKELPLSPVTTTRSIQSFSTEIQVPSSLDGAMQKCLVSFPEGYRPNEKTPLLVQLHAWGADYTHKSKEVVAPAGKRGWIAICVDYRGGNDHPKACASEFAVQDIVDAVNFMCAKYAIDKHRIYLCGGSGGGSMALVMAAKHPELWAAVVSFVPMTDLKKWYEEMDPASATGKVAEKSSPGFPRTIRRNIEAVCGGDPTQGGSAAEICAARSPLHFIERAKDVNLLIISGKADKLVPYHHGADAYKRLLAAGSTKARFVLADQGHYVDIEEGCVFLEKFGK